MLYGVPQYVSDMVTLVAHLNATKIDWFGTSMGGLIGMVYASMQGNPIQRLLLNDVGPRLEPDAIKRLSSYVGKPFLYADRQTALEALNNICQPFGQHSASEWEKLNGPMLEQTGQGWILHYDPNIVIPFSAITPALAVAGEYAMWKAFEQIQCPVLVVRGANSDLLSTKTVEEMSRRAPHVRSIEIPNVGHAPAFIQPEQIQIAREFFRIG
jgi:cobalt-zinc-cadmium efflux system protein